MSEVASKRPLPLDWFRLSAPVDRATYLKVGLGLAAAKYAVEWTVIWGATGGFFSPVDFVNPWLSSKAPFLMDVPAAGVIWLLFTIPFVWIAIAMSIRRAADIGITPWCGLLMLIPLVNLAAMAILAALPSGLSRTSAEHLAQEEHRRRELTEAFRPSAEVGSAELLEATTPWTTTFAAILMGCLTQTLVGVVSIWLLQTYGFILFFSAPVVAGAVTGFVHNRRQRRSPMATTGTIVAMNAFSFVVMLLTGLDGAICLLMAFPLLVPLSIAGGLVGAALAVAGLRPGVDEHRGMIGSIILLPLCLATEPLDQSRPQHRVTTTVEVDAPPEVVWQHVIAFPEIDAPQAWFFRLGIAAPLRATIDGEGEGATRHCEFTTGEFVEPITAWQPPHRLAFDVASQPHPMREWTPFPHLHPPHLDTGFVSRRGEFRLEAISGGRTRLHGTTWYQIDVRPSLYWKSWANPILHAIHRRVLEHIARQSTPSSTPSASAAAAQNMARPAAMPDSASRERKSGQRKSGGVRIRCSKSTGPFRSSFIGGRDASRPFRWKRTSTCTRCCGMWSATLCARISATGPSSGDGAARIATMAKSRVAVRCWPTARPRQWLAHVNWAQTKRS